ncbi:MAG: phosphoribosylaminoimidazolesuccinocarboxamide synthase [Verrucomicrobiota bacterium]
MDVPNNIPIARLGEPFYIGSVQRLYAIPGADSHMVTETTSAGSVFDVGSIFEVPGSDVARAVFRHALYSKMGDPAFWSEVSEPIKTKKTLSPSLRAELTNGLLAHLCDQGARTHHGGMIDAESGDVVTSGMPTHPSRFNVVERFEIRKPSKADVLGSWLFDYSDFPGRDGFVVPLEYIVRFGITGASSVFKKYQSLGATEQKVFEAELGVSKPLEAWQLLDRPISDCTTKFEPEDRSVSKQEALSLCGLSGQQFAKSMELAVLGASAVRYLLAEMGLLLWDIKWEFAKSGDDLVFVDTIDTDSLRATRSFEEDDQTLVVHFNKQAIRDYYRIIHGDWLEAVNLAKKLAPAKGVPFTEILSGGQASGEYPPTPSISEEFLTIQTRKMTAIESFMTGTLSAAETATELEKSGRQEIAFYSEAGKLDAFVELNRI